MKDGRATCHAQREGRACRQRRWVASERAVGVARGLRLSVRSRAFSRGGTRSSLLARARATTLLQSYARVTNVPRRSPLSRRIAPVMPLRRAGACLALFALIALALAPSPCDAQTTKQARSPALSSTPPRPRRNLPKRLASTRTATHRPASSLSHIVHRVAQATRRSAGAAADRPVVDDASRKYVSTQRPHPPKCHKDGSPCLAVEGYDDGKPCTGPYGTCVDGACEEGGDMSRILVKASISCSSSIVSHYPPDISPPPARCGLGSSTNTHRPLPHAVNRDEGCPCGDDLTDPYKCGLTSPILDPCVNKDQPCKCDGKGTCAINYLPDGTICDDLPLADPCKGAKQCYANKCTGACRSRGASIF